MTRTVDIAQWDDVERAQVNMATPFEVTASPYGETIQSEFATLAEAEAYVTEVNNMSGTYSTSWGAVDVNTIATIVQYVDSTPTAPVEVVATFQVCVDCMQWVAGIDEHERGEAYPAAVVEAMTAPEAATWHLVNTCGDDEETGHEYTCASFTYAPCDTCATWLGGERHAVAALSR